MTAPTDQPQAPPVQKLLHDLFRDADALIFQQFALLRAELSEAIAQLLRGSAVVLIGIEIAVAGLVMLLGALTFAAARLMPPWLACLLVGTVALGVALALLTAGRREIASAGFVPRRSAKTLRQAKQWFEDEFT